jgi:hypothetical protein
MPKDKPRREPRKPKKKTGTSKAPATPPQRTLSA